MAGRTRWIFSAILLLLYGAVAYRQLARDIPRGFRVPQEEPSAGKPSAYREEIVNENQNLPFVHVGSVVEGADGALAALWYGGPYEYSHENSIYLSFRKNGHWQKPLTVMTADQAERDLGRPIRCLGNPLILPNPDGSLRLLFITIAMGRWSGAQLNTCLSTDGGRSWSRAERLTLSPLCNFSELVRNRPIPLAGGGWCVPVYQELIGKFPELLWLRERGNRLVVSKSRIDGGCATLQPSLIPRDERQAVVLLRDWTAAKRIFVSRTGDSGRTWTKPEPTNLPNPDSGISGILLRDGQLMVAYNDSTSIREKLSLALSGDGGTSWRPLFRIENDPEACSSYPYLMRDREGEFHAVFTHEGDNIKMVSFNEAWIRDQETNEKP
jgi:predicted neuraminidase